MKFRIYLIAFIVSVAIFATVTLILVLPASRDRIDTRLEIKQLIQERYHLNGTTNILSRDNILGIFVDNSNGLISAALIQEEKRKVGIFINSFELRSYNETSGTNVSDWVGTPENFPEIAKINEILGPNLTISDSFVCFDYPSTKLHPGLKGCFAYSHAYMDMSKKKNKKESFKINKISIYDGDSSINVSVFSGRVRLTRGEKIFDLIPKDKNWTLIRPVDENNQNESLVGAPIKNSPLVYYSKNLPFNAGIKISDFYLVTNILPNHILALYDSNNQTRAAVVAKDGEKSWKETFLLTVLPSRKLIVDLHFNQTQILQQNKNISKMLNAEMKKIKVCLNTAGAKVDKFVEAGIWQSEQEFSLMEKVLKEFEENYQAIPILRPSVYTDTKLKESVKGICSLPEK